MSAWLRELARLLVAAQLATPSKQRAGTVATARPKESRRGPITPDHLRPAG